MRMTFYFDQSRCMGCNTCTVACKDYYNVNPGRVRYRKQFTAEYEGGFYPLAMSCNHCEEPICMQVCPVEAISKRADGVVIVDRAKCEGLRSCITACPFAEPDIADDKQEHASEKGWRIKHPMQKCNMCFELLDKGEKTICERSCPAHAIEVGDFESLKRKHPEAVQINSRKFPYAYLNGTDETGPSMLVKPRRQQKLS